MLGDSFFQFFDGDGEAVGFIRARHGHEGVVGDVAEVFDFGFDAPVPFVFL